MQEISSSLSPFTQPPRDVLQMIGDHLDARSLARASAVNRAWSRSLRRHPRWQQLCHTQLLSYDIALQHGEDFWCRNYSQAMRRVEALRSRTWEFSKYRPYTLRRPHLRFVCAFGEALLVQSELGALLFDTPAAEPYDAIHPSFRELPGLPQDMVITALHPNGSHLWLGCRSGEIFLHTLATLGVGPAVTVAQVPGRVLELRSSRGWLYVLYVQKNPVSRHLAAFREGQLVWDLPLPGVRYQFIQQFELNDKVGMLLWGTQFCFWEIACPLPPKVISPEVETQRLWTQFCLVGAEAFCAAGEGRIMRVTKEGTELWYQYPDPEVYVSDMLAGDTDFCVFTRHREFQSFTLDRFSVEAAEPPESTQLAIQSPLDGGLRLGEDIFTLDGEGRLHWIRLTKGIVRSSEERDMSTGGHIAGTRSLGLVYWQGKLVARDAHSASLVIIRPGEERAAPLQGPLTSLWRRLASCLQAEL